VLCPAAILLASFHGNSDPLVVAFLIWAVLCAEKRRSPFLTGLLFAVACSIKVWPLFLLPAFYLFLGLWRRRIPFLATVAAAWLAFGLPYTLQFPALIVRTVFGYRSAGGWWGLSGIIAGYGRFGTIVAFSAVILATIWMQRAGLRLYALVGGAIAVFLVFTPGFGVNYLAWILPFCFPLGWRAVAGIYTVSSILLCIAYTHWSGGLPWYFADLLRSGAAQSPAVLYAASVCWIVLVLAVLAAGGTLVRFCLPPPAARS
jgi:uncharacterized membrane protein